LNAVDSVSMKTERWKRDSPYISLVHLATSPA
jgi:hypothetical protein